MLVLTRDKGESLVIDGPCEIMLVRTKGKAARIGIKADRNVKVLRKELTAKPQVAAETGDDQLETSAA
tara:strand:+ start:163 stop:366 length:204 start_codon:yes stop_codon:yes gene_type:complete